MTTIKSFTSLEQSRKLAEILPLESADMYYECINEEPEYKVYVGRNIAIAYNLFSYRNGHTIPCWSLAALLSILPEKYTELIKEGGMYRIIIKDSYMTCLFDNAVDACVVMIERLHELNLL